MGFEVRFPNPKTLGSEAKMLSGAEIVRRSAELASGNAGARSLSNRNQQPSNNRISFLPVERIRLHLFELNAWFSQ